MRKSTAPLKRDLGLDAGEWLFATPWNVQVYPSAEANAPELAAAVS